MSNGEKPRQPTRKVGITPESEEGESPDNWDDPVGGPVDMEPGVPTAEAPDAEDEGRPDVGGLA
jgi:hypothetical protein